MLYLGAGSALTLVPWNEKKPGFHVSRLVSEEVGVRAQFSCGHVVYIGSHEGCGCGFQYGECPEEEAPEPDEIAAGEASKRALAEYLAKECERIGPIELFACWDGDQDAPIQHRRLLKPSDVAHAEFFFLELELSRVTPSPQAE